MIFFSKNSQKRGNELPRFCHTKGETPAGREGARTSRHTSGFTGIISSVLYCLGLCLRNHWMRMRRQWMTLPPSSPPNVICSPLCVCPFARGNTIICISRYLRNSGENLSNHFLVKELNPAHAVYFYLECKYGLSGDANKCTYSSVQLS